MDKRSITAIINHNTTEFSSSVLRSRLCNSELKINDRSKVALDPIESATESSLGI
ncbi:unnamed protein product [Sphenostylis stenocarpa]|uniref:Uncharacterized protein n=1 Tax=Sphenostylis stenocarpa TaxID=92480 RepID=A0AA86VYR3_9FABA|nr:unnamed protein product [Sphenostylis stenocarpa]